MQWLKKNRIHLLVWAIFAVYLLSANQIYTTFFLKNGKPLKGPVSLPAEKGEVLFNINLLETTTYQGQELYRMTGWVFIPTDENSPQHLKKIVLHSVSEDLVFQTKSTYRPDLNKTLTQYKQIDLDQAGFEMLISKDALKVDNYRIGFLLENEQGEVVAYKMVNAYVERQKNGLRLIIGD